MAVFYLIHAADIKSTVEGLKYSCIRESNPLLPDVPHLDRLILHKWVFLTPMDMLFAEGALDAKDVWVASAITAWVVYHNFEHVGKARDRCSLR